MKSIFKKIALVLALAMVVTMLPAKSVSVSAADASANKWTRKTCTLYIDNPVEGDKDGIYVSSAYATAAPKVKDPEGWKAEGYSVVFASDDETVATVGTRYGLVEAVGIGQTTITATYSKEGAADVVESFPVTVKRAAASVALDDESAKAVQELVVGADSVELKAVMADADGNIELVEKTAENGGKLSDLLSEGRQFVTDYLKFTVTNPEDKEVLKVEDNKLTAVAEGEATLVVKAYRYDWQSWGKTKSKYVKVVTAQAEIPVTVKEAGIVKAEQTAYNAFELTFDNEDVAKAASDETSKYFTSGNAAVTDKDDIVKVYEVLKNADGEVVGDGAAVIIGGISQKNNAKNVLSVTMFQELKQNTDYVVYYKNGKANFTTAENIAAGITISQGESVKESIDGVGSTTKIVLGIYTYGENGQEVNLDGCVNYDGWRNSVTLEEIGGEQYHPDYSVSTDPSDPYVDFYTDDTKVTATVRATLLDYFNEKKPGNPLVDQTVIRIGDYTTLDAKIADYGVHRTGSTHTTDGIYSSKEFAAEDVGMRLFVKLEIYRNGKTEEHFSEVEEGTFTFRSANEDKLIVGEKTGELFPAKEPTNDTVNVFVFYDGKLVGYCPIKVWEKRVLTSLTVEPNATKMSYNPVTGISDSITLTVKPLDQLKASFMQDVSVTCSVMGAADDYVAGTTVKNDKTYTLSPNSDGNAFTITFNPTTNLPTSQRSIRIVCTAVYDDGVTKRTLTASTSFSAKNTSASSVSRYDLNLSSTTLDMKLEDKNGGRVSDKKVGITVYTMDREGFKIEQLAVAPWVGGNVPSTGNYITVQKNNEYMGASDGFNTDGSQKLVFETVKESSGAYVVSRSAIENEVIPVKVNEQFLTTVSGAAISQMPHMLEKAETGNYQVSLYVGGKRVTGAVLQLKDTQPDVIAQNWKRNRVDGSAEKVGGVLDAIGKVVVNNNSVNVVGALEFKLGDMFIGNDIYVGEVEIDKATKLPTGKIILNNDIVVHGNSVAIRQVRYLLTHTENDTTYVYELEIPVNKTILVGVTQ